MITSEVNITSKSGNTIALSIRTPVTSIKGVVQINTGTCIPQQIYWKFAAYLSNNGYISITYDYSDASNYSSSVTHAAWLKDIESVTDYIFQTYPTLKKYAVGHSSGGQFIGYTNNGRHFDKIYLVACANGFVGNLSLPLRLMMLVLWKVIVPFSVKRYGFMNNKIFGAKGGFPKNIILELGNWCQQPDFFVSYFKQQQVPSYYHTITNPVKAYHLGDDVIANRKSCEYILNLYTEADRSIETLDAKDYGMKKFGHRGFFFASAETLLWPKFLQDLEQ